MTAAEVERPKRGRESIADMIRSLGLVSIVIAATLIFVPGLFHPSKSQRYPGVSYADYVAGFHQLSGRTALTPRSLPKGWAANAAALTGTKTTAHLHIGWATPGAKYAGLEESVASASAFVPATLGVQLATVTGSVAIGDATWGTVRSARGEYSLTRTIRGITVVITGSATVTQLQLLAASLH